MIKSDDVLVILCHQGVPLTYVVFGAAVVNFDCEMWVFSQAVPMPICLFRHCGLGDSGL